MALHSWSQLWILCDTRDQALHLFLPGSSCHPALQIWMRNHFLVTTPTNTAPAGAADAAAPFSSCVRL